MVFIYSLSDPTDNKVRYIGKAKDLSKRLKTHLRDSITRDTPVYFWIRELTEKGICPEIKEIAICPEYNWPDIEKKYISFYSEKGTHLLNVSKGGKEPFCKVEVRASNGKKVSDMIQKCPKKRHIWNLKRNMGKSLLFLSKQIDKKSYNKIVDKLRAAAEINPKLFSCYSALNYL